MQQNQMFVADFQGVLRPLLAGDASGGDAGSQRILPFGTDQDGQELGANFLTAKANSDGTDSGDVNGFTGLSVPFLFNGTEATGFYRARSASAANLVGANAIVGGVQLMQKAANWSVQHEPAVTVRATISRAASPGVMHVCTSISGSIMAVAAIAAPMYLRLRDGATGTGTILWSCGIIAPIGVAVPINISDLSISGTAGNAMTLEFAAAPGASNFQTVAMTGFDAT